MGLQGCMTRVWGPHIMGLCNVGTGTPGPGDNGSQGCGDTRLQGCATRGHRIAGLCDTAVSISPPVTQGREPGQELRAGWGSRLFVSCPRIFVSCAPACHLRGCWSRCQPRAGVWGDPPL